MSLYICIYPHDDVVKLLVFFFFLVPSFSSSMDIFNFIFVYSRQNVIKRKRPYTVKVRQKPKTYETTFDIESPPPPPKIRTAFPSTAAFSLRVFLLVLNLGIQKLLSPSSFRGLEPLLSSFLHLRVFGTLYQKHAKNSMYSEHWTRRKWYGSTRLFSSLRNVSSCRVGS